MNIRIPLGAWTAETAKTIQQALIDLATPRKYTVASLPDAARNEGVQLYVKDESGGAVTAFSDGLDWRRTTDRAIVS